MIGHLLFVIHSVENFCFKCFYDDYHPNECGIYNKHLEN